MRKSKRYSERLTLNEHRSLRKTCITIRREKTNCEPRGKNVLT